jgi:predicted dehydrogenase
LKRSDTAVKYVCDADKSKLGDISTMIEEMTGKAPQQVQDFRQALDDPDVDAMLIATGHNWHALATIMACQAGKDVYVEKPMSLTLWEGRKAVEAARKYNRVVQVGTQTRSAPDFKEALEYVHSGKLGTVRLLRGQEFSGYRAKDQKPQGKNAPVPDSLDYDMWCGPSPKASYWPGNWWQGHWDYSLGLGDHAAHQLDILRAFVAEPYPKSVFCAGGVIHAKDGRETPDSLYMVFEYDQLSIVHQCGNWFGHMRTPFHPGSEALEHRRWALKNHIELLGTEGILFTGRHGAGWQVFQREGREQSVVASSPQHPNPLDLHLDNFMECVRTRKRPNADVEEAHLSMVLVHIANAAHRAGNLKLRFDGETETFVDAPEANKYLKRTGRAPWIIPEQV